MTYAADAIWCRSHFDTMADGGIWAVPRSGLIFTRRGAALELTGRMPWTDELAQAFGEGRMVPANAEALRAYQDADYELIRSRFEAAGITVRDATPRAGASAEEPYCPYCTDGVDPEDQSELCGLPGCKGAS